MAQLVVMGAKAKCSMASARVTASLVLVPNMVNGTSKTVATIQDFSITRSRRSGCARRRRNPAVAAAQGSPGRACIPAIAAPWSPGSSTVTVGGKPALLSDSTPACARYGGMSSSIDDAGQSDITTG